jgi:hypothetical protein
MGDETMVPPRKKRRLDARGRVLRRGRIFPRLREGYAYDEIARAEQLTPERVRQIVREALERRIVDDETDHAKLQLARLAQAMQIASAAVADVKAMPPFLKVPDRLDCYQRSAKVNAVYDDEAQEAPRQDQPRRRQSRRGRGEEGGEALGSQPQFKGCGWTRRADPF